MPPPEPLPADAHRALAGVWQERGLAAYLARVEQRLLDAVGSHPGLVGAIAADAIAAGGKRLRPAVVYLASPPEREPSVAAGAAVELLHLGTLIHDDAVDRAPLRRGQPTAWSVHGRRAAVATGDYLLGRATAQVVELGDAAHVRAFTEAALLLVRGESMQHRQTHDAATSIGAYLRRCELKTGRLFALAIVLARGARDDLGRFGSALGMLYQIVDDVRDCRPDAVDGKAAGCDLRGGVPTLPLQLAARSDAVVRAALAGRPADDAFERIAASGALERSLEIAGVYAARALDALEGREVRPALRLLPPLLLELAGGEPTDGAPRSRPVAATR
jgi:octaprenyl-diphosphate synthase